MTRQEIFDWCKKKYGTDRDYPWNDWTAVLRHPENKKWYAIVMEVDSEKIGLPAQGIVDIMNVKCDPVMIGSLRSKPGYFPAYHMNKENWISIQLDGPEPDTEVKGLIDISYELTQGK